MPLMSELTIERRFNWLVIRFVWLNMQGMEANHFHNLLSS